MSIVFNIITSTASWTLLSCLHRFETVMDHLSKSKKGQAAVEYIQKIDESLYSRQAFPLPRLGKVTSNPAEQTNSGLLQIQEFAPFKLLVSWWDYIQQKFNVRCKNAVARNQYFLFGPAEERHNVNLQTFEQWLVLDDGNAACKSGDNGWTA
jgi:hypothetical protein